MKMTPTLLHRKLLWITLLLLGGLGLRVAESGVPDKLAQGAGAPTGPPVISPISPTAPPELVKPALPSDFQRAESMFRKLDVANQGYLTREDTKDLIGFEAAFRAADPQDSGKLTPGQFKKAWSIYTRKK